jgi:hypothetical protein
MSIYTILRQDVPTLAIVDWFTAPDAASMREFVKRLHQASWAMEVQSRGLQQLWNEHIADLTATGVQRTRGMLSPFLSTPLTSDNKEIQRTIAEQFEYVTDQVFPQALYGVLAIVNGRIQPEGAGSAAIKTLAAAGSKHLRATLALRGKAPMEAAERMSFIQGSMNLDVFDAIDGHPTVRESMGALPIHRSVHELRFLRGTLVPGNDLHEAVLTGAAGVDIESVLVAAADASSNDAVGHCSVWQNRLVPGEVTVRIRASERSTAKEALTRILEMRGRQKSVSPFTKNGRLYWKELTPNVEAGA